MTRDELLKAIQSLPVPADAYCLDGAGAGECYCLEADGLGWIVYYSERGERQSVVWFSTEEEANERFLAKLKSTFCR